MPTCADCRAAQQAEGSCDDGRRDVSDDFSTAKRYIDWDLPGSEGRALIGQVRATRDEIQRRLTLVAELDDGC